VPFLPPSSCRNQVGTGSDPEKAPRLASLGQETASSSPTASSTKKSGAGTPPIAGANSVPRHHWYGQPAKAEDQRPCAVGDKFV